MTTTVSQRTKFIQHQGKDIFLIDLSEIHEEAEALAVVAEARRIVTSRPAGSVLTLTYVKGGRFTRDVVTALKEMVAANKPYVKAGAVVGMSGLQRAIYIAVTQFSGRRLELCDSIEAAKDYLVAQK